LTSVSSFDPRTPCTSQIRIVRNFFSLLALLSEGISCLALSSSKHDAQAQGSTPIPILECSTWNIFKRRRTFSLLASSPEPSLCVSHLLNQQATGCADSRINSYSNARMFHVEHFQEKVFYSLNPYQHDPQNESARSPFKYSDLPAVFECSTWNIFKRRPHFFSTSLVSRTLSLRLSPSQSASNTMRRLKDQLLFQCSNVPCGTFSKKDHTFSLLNFSPEPLLFVSQLLKPHPCDQ
jgi:hypothetical protein